MSETVFSIIFLRGFVPTSEYKCNRYQTGMVLGFCRIVVTYSLYLVSSDPVDGIYRLICPGGVVYNGDKSSVKFIDVVIET